MSSRKLWITLGAAAFAVAGWALFRPELLFVNSTVNEALPAARAAAQDGAPVVLAMGQFRSGAHETKGTATIHQVEGREVLRLSGFETSNGPDVRVYLVAAADAKGNDTVKEAGFVDLGALKGNRGDQNYEIPAGTDLMRHRAVTIWCRRFGVNFGTAPLAEAASTAASGPMKLSAGAFHSGAHETKGEASIFQLEDGKRLLRLTDFHTSNGPDVRIYLVAAADAKDNETVKQAGFIDLGALKGTQGSQNYDVPVDVDLTKHRSVTVWCRRFGVNFGTAPLEMEQS